MLSVFPSDTLIYSWSSSIQRTDPDLLVDEDDVAMSIHTRVAVIDNRPPPIPLSFSSRTSPPPPFIHFRAVAVELF